MFHYLITNIIETVQGISVTIVTCSDQYVINLCLRPFILASDTFHLYTSVLSVSACPWLRHRNFNDNQEVVVLYLSTGVIPSAETTQSHVI